jgi:hypothetical protein
VAHCIKGIPDGFDQLIDVVWRLLVLKRLDRLEESEIDKKLLSLISMFEHKLDNNFGMEGVPYSNHITPLNK